MNKLFSNLKVLTRKILNTSVLVYLILIGILFVGLILSILGFETAFQRSGAIIVGLSLLSVSMNSLISWQLNLSETLTKSKDSISSEEALACLEKHIKDVPDLKEFVQNSIDEPHAVQMKLRNEMVKLQNFEFLAAFLGTLIWAFGDLPFIWLYKVARKALNRAIYNASPAG